MTCSNGVEARKEGNKIDVRNIIISVFDGTVQQGGFDAKAQFRDELDEQMQDT